MKAAIYCRVSTAMQEEEGSSLDTQEERCRAYAAERGWQVVTVYRETHTGSELWERPQLTALRETVREGAVDVMLAYALDRLSRKQTHVAIIADDCERAGAVLAFVTEDFEKSAVGTFLRSAKAFAAELEREKIAERTQRGLLARVTSGKLRPGIRALYGYEWNADRTRYVINADKAAIVRRVFDRIAAGGTLNSVARILTDDGVPTPNGSPRWLRCVLQQMLRNEAYMGVAYAYKTSVKKVNGKRTFSTRPIAEQVFLPAGTIPAIVLPERFAAVQERLDRNKAQAVRNNQNPEAFLLRGGFVRCAHCGHNVRTAWVPGYKDAPRRAVYMVKGNSSNHPGCPECGINAAILDEAVWEKVRTLVMQPEVVMREVERVKTDDPTTDDRASVESLLTETRRKRDNLTRALADIDDADVQTSVLSELKVVSQRVRDLETERDTLTAQRDAWQVSRDQLDSLSAWLGVVSTNIDALTYQQKRDLLTALDVQVTLHPAAHTPRYTITASLPLDDDIVSATSMSRSSRRGRRCGRCAGAPTYRPS